MCIYLYTSVNVCTHVHIYIYIYIYIYMALSLLLSVPEGAAGSTSIISSQIACNCNLAQVSFLAAVRAQPRCHTADMSGASHSRRVCCVTRQTCRLWHAADMSSQSYSRHVRCVPQQTCLLSDTADMSAV